ncbi:replication initiator [Nonomuraea angiospora]
MPGDEPHRIVSTTPDTAVVFKPAVVQTPAIITLVIFTARFVAGLFRLVWRHPVALAAISTPAGLCLVYGWRVALLLVVPALVAMGAWAILDRPTFARWIGWRLVAFGRWFWIYRRRWQPVMTVAGLAQREHAGRFVDALRYEPCSPTCPNWLRYGVQPKSAKPGMIPGQCRSKAHKPEHLGYAGRRVLVSRKWSNKTLAEHKQDRRTWVLEALGQVDEPTDPHRYVWQPVRPGDPDVAPIGVRLLRSIAERQRWRAHLRQLEELSATPKAA